MAVLACTRAFVGSLLWHHGGDYFRRGHVGEPGESSVVRAQLMIDPGGVVVLIELVGSVGPVIVRGRPGGIVTRLIRRRVKPRESPANGINPALAE